MRGRNDVPASFLCPYKSVTAGFSRITAFTGDLRQAFPAEASVCLPYSPAVSRTLFQIAEPVRRYRSAGTARGAFPAAQAPFIYITVLSFRRSQLNICDERCSGAAAPFFRDDMPVHSEGTKPGSIDRMPVGPGYRIVHIFPARYRYLNSYHPRIPVRLKYSYSLFRKSGDQSIKEFIHQLEVSSISRVPGR